MLVVTIDALGHLNRVITAQCEGMGEVGSARSEPALLPPCPSIRALCSVTVRDPPNHTSSLGVKNIFSVVLVIFSAQVQSENDSNSHE